MDFTKKNNIFLKKEKIYLIPGLMTDERLWEELIFLLKDKYELVHVNIPKTSDFFKMNKELENIFKEERVNLLGFSLGGYIATNFAMANTKRVKRLFLLASTPSSTNKIEIQRRLFKIEQIKKEGFKNLTYKKAQSLLEEKNKNNEKLICTMLDMYNTLGEKIFISQLLATTKRENLYEDFKNLKIPIYFYYSQNDRLLNHNAINKIKDLNLENISMFSREGTSHNISLEDANNLCIHIKKWMKV